MVVEIKGTIGKFDGKYRLTSVRHEYRKGVYESHFRVEGRKPQLLSDMVGGGSGDDSTGGRWYGVVIAIVTNNDDPENLGRVKLKFPWLDENSESNWARVSMPGAGKERGLFIMPEVDDEVLVGFEQGDFNNPIVIGGLYNGKDAPPLTMSDSVTGGQTFQRQWKTRTGHMITLYDDNSGQEYIEIKDAKANTQVKFDTTNKVITMKSEGDVEILAQGNMTFKSQSGNIQMEAGSGNVNIKGLQFVAEGTSAATMKSNGTTDVQGMSTTVKGNGTTEVSSTGIMTIRGSLVNIN